MNLDCNHKHQQRMLKEIGVKMRRSGSMTNTVRLLVLCVSVGIGWIDQTTKQIQRRPNDSLAPQHVLDLSLRESARYALEVCGMNFWENPSAAADQLDGTSLLSLDSGWTLRVKLIPKVALKR